MGGALCVVAVAGLVRPLASFKAHVMAPAVDQLPENYVEGTPRSKPVDDVVTLTVDAIGHVAAPVPVPERRLVLQQIEAGIPDFTVSAAIDMLDHVYRTHVHAEPAISKSETSSGKKETFEWHTYAVSIAQKGKQGSHDVWLHACYGGTVKPFRQDLPNAYWPKHETLYLRVGDFYEPQIVDRNNPLAFAEFEIVHEFGVEQIGLPELILGKVEALGAWGRTLEGIARTLDGTSVGLWIVDFMNALRVQVLDAVDASYFTDDKIQTRPLRVLMTGKTLYEQRLGGAFHYANPVCSEEAMKVYVKGQTLKLAGSEEDETWKDAAGKILHWTKKCSEAKTPTQEDEQALKLAISKYELLVPKYKGGFWKRTTMKPGDTEEEEAQNSLRFVTSQNCAQFVVDLEVLRDDGQYKATFE